LTQAIKDRTAIAPSRSIKNKAAVFHKTSNHGSSAATLVYLHHTVVAAKENENAMSG
jgi:hypothetical protein